MKCYYGWDQYIIFPLAESKNGPAYEMRESLRICVKAMLYKMKQNPC